MRGGAIIALFVLSGCSLGLGGLGADPNEAGVSDDGSTGNGNGSGGSNDASSPPGEAGVIDAVAPPPYVDAPAGSCLASIPSGWNLVVYEAARNACPSGYASHDLVVNPQAAADACTCSCTITTQPSCTSGTLQFRFGQDMGMGAGKGNPQDCSMQAQPLAVASSACTALPMPRMGGGASASVAVSSLPGTGGACSGSVVGSTSAVTVSDVRTCDVSGSASAEEAVCDGTAPSGFAACIVAVGDSPCPSGSPFQTRSVVAASETLVCSACSSCLVTPACTSAEVTFFADTACSTQPVTIPANGMCTMSNFGTITAFEYQAQLNATCSATGTSASFNAVSPQTVCCR